MNNPDKALQEGAILAQKDPYRPVYHFLPPAYWLNDPNGPVYYKGEYHMFYQLNPFSEKEGIKYWGHAKSRDMLHWEHLPIALAPGPEVYDKDGVWSGCCVVHEGIPTIIYTGQSPQTQCLARSYDDMLTWKKYEGNPVIKKRPGGLNLNHGFRDPFAWQENGIWYMILGSDIKNTCGVVLLYKSTDLVQWEFLNILYTGDGSTGYMWECPNFFPAGDKHLLCVCNDIERVYYYLGDYKEHKFMPGKKGVMDLGRYYAPNTLKDEKGRWIMWGWIKGGSTEGCGWNGMLSLPRVISLSEDNELLISPLPELDMLRCKHTAFTKVTVPAGSPYTLKDRFSYCIELCAEFAFKTGDSPGIIFSNHAGKEEFRICYDDAARQLSAGTEKGTYQTRENKLSLHIFLDRSVVEVYADNKQPITCRIHPERIEQCTVTLFSRTGDLQVTSLDVWEIKSVR